MNAGGDKDDEADVVPLTFRGDALVAFPAFCSLGGEASVTDDQLLVVNVEWLCRLFYE